MNGLGTLQNYVTGGEVSQAYREILGRAPDTGGLQFYTNPNLSLADLKAQLADSSEGRAFLASQAPTGSSAAMQSGQAVAPGTGGSGTPPLTVADLYTKYLGREADPGGLASWTSQFGPTVDANELAKFLGAASTKAEIAGKTTQPVTTAPVVTTPATTTGVTTTGNTNTNTTTNPYVGNTAPVVSGEYTGAAGMAKARADIQSTFNSYLGRAPTENDIGYYINQLTGGGKTLAQLQSDISGTPEAQSWYSAQHPTTTDTGGITTLPATTTPTTITPTTVTQTSTPAKALSRDQINQLYLQTLGRAGDPGGLDYYQGQNVTRDQLVNSMLGSQEFRVPTGIQAIAPRREAATLQSARDFGAPAYMGGAPMTAATAKDLGTKFVAPEDYAKVFTPETTYTTQDPLLTEAPASTETAEPHAGGGYIGENQDYSEYMAGQAEGGSVNMARGGQVPSHGLRGAAQHLAKHGRGKDSMLVHMTPDEVHGLRSLAHMQGHDMPINPHTGLPEAGWFSSLFKNIMKVVPFILPFTGLGALASAGISGLAGATSGGGFNLKKGLMSGLMSYGVGSLADAAKGANAAASATSAGTTAAQAAKSLVDPSQIGQGYGSIAKDYIAANAPSMAVEGVGGAAKAGIESSMQTGSQAAMEASKAAATNAAQSGIVGGYQAAAPAINALAGQASAAIQPAASAASQAIANPDLINKGLAAASDFGGRTLDATKNIGSTAYNLATDPAARKTFAETMARNAAEGPNLGLQNALTATGVGASGLVAATAEEKYAKEAADVKAAEDEKNERMRQRVYEIMRGNPIPQNYGMAGGGMASYARGGNSTAVPRMLDGPGDGMSDSIPAMIGDKQPARLADGEFVIPADIVSHLGNGSSKAGSKQLYAMMDRIRKARTGRSSQAPEVRATKLMPA